MRVNYETSVKVRGLCLRFLNNMGSGLVVGLGSGSIYRIIQIYVPYLPSGEGQVTIGVGDKGPFLQRMSVRLGLRLHIWPR
jgi:hypothetical protein